VNFLGLAAPE
jgi:hypothetical protein